ncbi:hypothetical protein J4461_01200 [Candidatus Pacearchaeota archaeon]|nr:hypothetical protein [Candidatus Pacearchaeota archaeon]
MTIVSNKVWYIQTTGNYQEKEKLIVEAEAVLRAASAFFITDKFSVKANYRKCFRNFT